MHAKSYKIKLQLILTGFLLCLILGLMPLQISGQFFIIHVWKFCEKYYKTITWWIVHVSPSFLSRNFVKRIQTSVTCWNMSVSPLIYSEAFHHHAFSAISVQPSDEWKWTQNQNNYTSCLHLKRTLFMDKKCIFTLNI